MRRIPPLAWMLAVAAVFVLLFGTIGFGIRQLTAPALPDPVRAAPVDMAGQDLLVDAAWLADRLASDTPPIVVDVSEKRLYDAGHIPGAIHAWWQDAMGPHETPYGTPLRIVSDPAGLAPFAPYLGATRDDAIVVYDNSASEHAAWLVWWLRSSGFPKVAVLDGGLAAWTGAGYELSTEPAAPRDVAPEDAWAGVTWDPASVIGADEAVNRRAEPNMVFLDARSDAERQDTLNDTMRIGQIPDSVWLPASAVMRPDGTFRSPEELRDILAPLDVQPGNEVVVYGQFTTGSARLWLALRLAGYEYVRVLDGGWQWWDMVGVWPIEPLP